MRAWETYAPDAIGDLFTADATYAWHPWDDESERITGRDAIVKAWLSDRDAPGRYSADYTPLAIDGNIATATGRTRYYDAEGKVEREFYNLFVMRFAPDGRCAAFTEWFMQTPEGRL